MKGPPQMRWKVEVTETCLLHFLTAEAIRELHRERE